MVRVVVNNFRFWNIMVWRTTRVGWKWVLCNLKLMFDCDLLYDVKMRDKNWIAHDESLTKIILSRSSALPVVRYLGTCHQLQSPPKWVHARKRKSKSTLAFHVVRVWQQGIKCNHTLCISIKISAGAVKKDEIDKMLVLSEKEHISELCLSAVACDETFGNGQG